MGKARVLRAGSVVDGSKPIKVDIGCGKNKKEGFVGADSIKFPGVDIVMDIRKRWPWKDNTVDEVHCSHVLEHLTNFNDKWERVHFFNELHRVLKKDAKCTLVIPHWASSRYYGDPTHKEPFSEFGFYYLDKGWREINAPHTGYTCDFLATWGYGLHPALQSRNTEYQQNAMQWWKEAISDIHATLTKK